MILSRIHTLRTSLRVDPILLMGLVMLSIFGLIVLYSATEQNHFVLFKQVTRLFTALVLMLICAHIPPRYYRQWTPWLYLGTLTLLIVVLIAGHIGKGAQRWLNLGLFHFQPSELMKIAAPLMVAWYLHNKPLPPRFKEICVSFLIFTIPALLVIKQPDLGTGIIIGLAGVLTLLFAGLNWRLIAGTLTLALFSAPLLWHYLHTYQKQRILTFLNPEKNPLGAGYHIIQSKIAFGSGGLFGKGWLNGTQSHLKFLPEHATDFIFAVCGEEFGLFGCLILLMLLLFITARCLYISTQAQTTFTRLFAASVSLTFFVSYFINIGMVTGILPIVGIPLPLTSYGGTSMVTLMATFGILMSIHCHKSLMAN